MLRRYLLLLGFIALALPSRHAFAQQSGMAGDGIRLGEAMVLHLGLGLELDYDTNVFYTATAPTGAFELHLLPEFDLTTRGRQGRRQIEFDFNGGLNYLEYLTGDPTVSRLRQFGVKAGILASFFPTHPYNFVIFDNYLRSTQAPYTVLPYNLDHDVNEVGTRVNLSPGGGRLTFNIGYLFGIDYWEPTQLRDFDLQYHRFDLRASWRFFPKTALYIAAYEGLYLYQHPGVTMHPNSYPFHVDLGLQGLITTKLTVNAWIGYGNGFYASGPSPNTAVGGLSLNWKPTLLSTGGLGYRHDFINSLLGSYYDLDEVYLSWQQQIWRFLGYLRFSYANERFQGICQNPMTMTGTSCMNASAETVPNRADNLITLYLHVDYHFKDWLIGTVGNDLQVNLSNGALMLGAAGTVPVNYTKDVVYLRLTASY